MKKKPNDDGKPMCCAPGDLSACMIETTEERNETQLEANLPAGSRVTDDTKNRGKAQPVAADENHFQESE
jgi:hypothetical protein